MTIICKRAHPFDPNSGIYTLFVDGEARAELHRYPSAWVLNICGESAEHRFATKRAAIAWVAVNVEG